MKTKYQKSDLKKSIAFCQSCGGKTRVLDSRRPTVYGLAKLYRRRECKICFERYSTCEVSQEALDKINDQLKAMELIIKQVDALKEIGL